MARSACLLFLLFRYPVRTAEPGSGLRIDPLKCAASSSSGIARSRDVLGDRETFTDAQREQLKRVINDGIDFTAMGRAALGPFWADPAPAQREEFVDVFSRIVRNQSLSDLDVYRSVVTYGNITANDTMAYVTTTTVYKDIPAKVEYVLGRTGPQWQVRDIILDDVSTAEGYARSFQSVVRKRGFDSLMNSLRKKLDGMRS